MNSEPLLPSASLRPGSRSSGRSGRLPPSYHVRVQGGILRFSPVGSVISRAGKWYLRTEELGAISFFNSDEVTRSIRVGLIRPNDQTAPSMMWQAMSPRAPQPKSHQPRQEKG